MRLSFNTAGPCIPSEHYMIPPHRRLARVMDLIEARKYFTLHAGRQTGKTTSAKALVRHYNAGTEWSAAWVDIQTARDQPKPELAFPEVLSTFVHALARDLPLGDWPAPASFLEMPSSAILEFLRETAARSSRPLILFVDEADSLVGDAMISCLTQLRSGYIDRETTSFPASVVLIGQRQVRDYVVSAESLPGVAWLGTSSPFNITAESATLGPFSGAEVAELLEQHTRATGQVFEPEAIEEIAFLSAGHPWLVNALAAQITDSDVKDRMVPITKTHVEAAKETIIRERRSHIDSLVARLREPRVRRILEPMLVGSTTAPDVLDDDFAYVKGLGLIEEGGGTVRIANPIYREVIPRALTHLRQIQIQHPTTWYVRPDGSLDIERLLRAWQVFWRKDGLLAAAGFDYREAGPHLMLMAFLQRVVNGGGRVEREYALGRGALDLMIFFGRERHAIEVKLRRDTETEAEALDQVCQYLDSSGLAEGYLVLFDLRKSVSWQEKLTWNRTRHLDRTVTIVGS